MNLDEYLDAAKKRLNTTSDNELARRIGITGSTLNRYRNTGTRPDRDHMVKIAQLAGINEQLALCDWLAWESEGPARRVATEMRKLIAGALVLAILIGASTYSYVPPAQAAVTDAVTNTVYYVKSLLAFLARIVLNSRNYQLLLRTVLLCACTRCYPPSLQSFEPSQSY